MKIIGLQSHYTTNELSDDSLELIYQREQKYSPNFKKAEQIWNDIKNEYFEISELCYPVLSGSSNLSEDDHYTVAKYLCNDPSEGLIKMNISSIMGMYNHNVLDYIKQSLEIFRATSNLVYYCYPLLGLIELFIEKSAVEEAREILLKYKDMEEGEWKEERK